MPGFFRSNGVGDGGAVNCGSVFPCGIVAVAHVHRARNVVVNRFVETAVVFSEVRVAHERLEEITTNGQGGAAALA